ncbi:hypothetical protein T440DRAFT_444385 [Plenodomus tracheiphilus IPT5]|uniref:Uncharacterized protein n=1 Tax=Plenodomus tracheiphilus IPT5 TaxID=1408161 RepID=A0A6A7BHA1_9PLEO|nr:hypothetical protein T440DRAFT_444385 [Plenodomus tracheiphilus IPT5]
MEDLALGCISMKFGDISESEENDASYIESHRIDEEDESSDEEDPSIPQTYVGGTITFPDGSRWELTQPLSPLKYQQGTPPFEARQVFECICVADPEGKFSDQQKAVIKIKYQVTGTNDSIAFFWKHSADSRVQHAAAFRKIQPVKHRAREAYKKALEDIQDADYLYRLATNPADRLHEYTENEIRALRRLTEVKCAYAPRLLDSAMDNVLEEVDEQAMPGGYAVFMLMTKVPGEALDWKTFWSLDQDAREEVRCAFKVAMKNLWTCGIWPRDYNMSNMIWDKKEQKLYFVDFETYADFGGGMKIEEIWSDRQYKAWGLAEESGIPVSIGANEAVHQQRLLDEEAEAEERQEEFYLDVFCDAQSKKKDEVNGSIVVLEDGKVRLWPKDPKTNLPTNDPNGNPPPHPFKGFYLPFPTQDLPHRPIPAAPILGLVTTVPPTQSTTSSTSSPPTKPKLNWLYANPHTRELHYGPRAEAKKHTVGPWDWTDDEQGITLEGEECLVAVEEERGGYGWSVYWDREDDALKGVGVGSLKRVLRCSLERRVIGGKKMRGLDEE